jgi:hypothetical protein
VRDLDGTLIEDSIGTAAMCADCIAGVTRLSTARLNEALAQLIGALRVASGLAACAVCLKQKVVHRCA